MQDLFIQSLSISFARTIGEYNSLLSIKYESYITGYSDLFPRKVTYKLRSQIEGNFETCVINGGFCEVGLEYKELVQEKDYASIPTNIYTTKYSIASYSSDTQTVSVSLYITRSIRTYTLDKADIELKSLGLRLAPIPLPNNGYLQRTTFSIIVLFNICFGLKENATSISFASTSVLKI